MEQRTQGVYIIRNLNTGKPYVGGSTWVEQRLAQHRAMMAAGCHPNPRLRGAVEASGLDRFEFKCVEVVLSVANIGARELEWIKRLDAVNNGYNQTYRTEHYSKPDLPAPNAGISWPALCVIAAICVLLVVLL